VEQIDGLERPNHHLEVVDLAVGIPVNHVDAIDVNAIDLGRELEHRVGITDDLPNVGEAAAAEHHDGRAQIELRKLLPPLRCVNDRRMKHRVLGQDVVQACCVFLLNEPVPSINRGCTHAGDCPLFRAEAKAELTP
jgi:hypothetical protein